MGSCLSTPVEREKNQRPRKSVRRNAFTSLPADVLLLIIGALRSELTREKQLSQMRILAEVCSSLRSLVLHEQALWQCIYVRGARAVHDLSYAMLRGNNPSIELGIDFSARRGAHPIEECSVDDVPAALEIVAKSMHLIRVLSISIRAFSVPALKLLSTEAPLLEELTVYVYRGSIFANDSGILDNIFSGVAPRLRVLSISGVYIPALPAGIAGSLQTLTLRGSLLSSSNLRHILTCCSSSLRELDLRNCRMINDQVPDTEQQYPLALRTLSLDSVEEFRFDTAMHRSRSIVLEMLYWNIMGVNARKCFQALSSLKSLELIRNPPYDDSRPGVVISAETETGLQRKVSCYFPDSQQGTVSPVVIGVTGECTVRFLVLTLEWIDDFMQYSRVICEFIEELTLVHGWSDKFYFSTSEHHRNPRDFPALKRIILDVHDADVANNVLKGVKIVLGRLISSPAWWEGMLEVRPRSLL